MLLVYAYLARPLNLINAVVLSPFFSGTLLFAVIRFPHVIQDAIALISSKLPVGVEVPRSFLSMLRVALQALLATSILRQINQGLNTLAHNSWRVVSRSHWNWPNEIAVVTGASSGIGKDMAHKLADLGIQVAVLDIQKPPKDLQSHQNIAFYQCDVTSTKSIAAAADSIRKELGHPTILINNAGITLPTPILQLPESFLRKIVGVNLMSLWFTTQEFLPHMIQMNKGHIITIASMASFIALPRGADYSATKAGALAFHESLACELKHFYKSPKILTTVVHPNFVSTPLITDLEQHLKGAGMPILNSQYVAEQVVSQVKCGRGGQLIIGAPSVVSGIRGWPTWLQELFRDVLGKLEARSGGSR